MASSRLEAVRLLARSLRDAPAGTRPVLAHLALRAALHRELRPYLLDPLLPLDGQFPSLDAHVRGVLDFAATHGHLPALLTGLPAEDRAALEGAGLFAPAVPPGRESAGMAGPSVDTGKPLDVVGALWAALWVSAEARAVPVRVRTAYVARSEKRYLDRWPAPVPVRPVGEEIAASAQAAFAAALHVWERAAAGAAPPEPGLLFFDVSVPGGDATESGPAGGGDALVAHAAGDSLGLPLALAFLSSLTGAELPPDLGASGAVGRDPRRPGVVSSVGWIAEKGDALLPVCRRFLVPGEEAVGAGPRSGAAALPAAPVASVREAAGHAGLLPEDSTAPDRRAAEIAPPTGEGVIFLFLEIGDFARLRESVPAALRDALHDCTRIVWDGVARHDGLLFKQTAGGFHAAFADARPACEAALDIQQATRSHLWPEAVGPLRLRMGLHKGRGDFFGGDYYGPAAAQTGRLMAAAHGGQILLSESLRADLSAAFGAPAAPPPEGVPTVEALGVHRLRDLSEPVALFQLSRGGAGGAASAAAAVRFDPPRTLEARRHNLPVQLTPLLGRDADVARIVGHLQGAGRLLTLTGPGGVGKTRLALQAAAELVDVFPGGVWFVDLSERRPEATDIAAAVAEALRLEATADRLGQVKRALADGRALLLLDNFENVLPAGAGWVADLLRRAPGVACLVTSRALLQIRGEQRFEVPPLPLPDEPVHPGRGRPHGDDVRGAAAVALFCDRARAARMEWELAPGDAPAVVEICRRLDGLPLAIELAAARVRTLSPGEIAARLSDAFRLLVSRTQDVPERHRTLQATLEWSYQLLDAAERRLLNRLSVFAGSFTAEAAEAVGADPDTLDTLATLEEKSLVTCRIEDGIARYRLLMMIREFARDKLAAASEERASARAAHAAHYRWVALFYGGKADHADEVSAFDVLDADKDNLRAGAEWLQETDPAALAEPVVALCEFLWRRGYWRDLLLWIRAGLAAADATGRRDQALYDRLRYQRARCEIHTAGNAAEAAAAEERARAVVESAEARGDLLLAADTLHLLGLGAQGQHGNKAARRDEAAAYHAEALARYRTLGAVRGIAVALNSLGGVAAEAGDLVRGRERFEEAIGLCRASGDRRGLAIALGHLGAIALREGDTGQAEALFREHLELSRSLKDAREIARGLLNLGTVYEHRGDVERAVPHVAAANQLLKEIGLGAAGEADEVLARCAPRFGAGRLEALRNEYAGRTAAYLQRVDLSVRPLGPVVAAVPAATEAG